MRALLLLIPLVACGPPPLEVVREAGGLGLRGVPGPYAVGRTAWRAPADVTASMTVEVHVPVGADDLALAGPLPPVVFVHGGLVEPQRYRWWAEHVASRGYAVVTATHPADLAIFAQGHSTDALDALREASLSDGPLQGVVDPDARAAIAGHSLGGVVAARSFVAAPEDYATVGIIASFPAPWDDLTSRGGDPVLSIVGANDGSADLGRVQEAILAQPAPRLYAVVEGFNHYDWADGVSQAELDRDGERARPVDEARADAMRVMDTWLDAWLRDRPEAREDWATEDFPGVREQR